MGQQRIDTSAWRATYRHDAQQADPAIRPLLLAIADAWDAAEASHPSETEARRWSPVISAATDAARTAP